MNRRYVAAATAGILSAAVFTSTAFAQAAPAAGAAAPAAGAQQAPVQPAAIPAKIALIAFEQVVFATNEGQAATAAVTKKYEPQKAKLDALNTEIDSLKKQLQAGSTLSDQEKQERARTIDTKEKQLQRDGEDASAAYQQDLQQAYGTVAQKVNETMRKYASDNGYTIVLDVSGQQTNVLWAAQQTDISRAVVDAYNTSSGVAAPPPAAPGAGRPAAAPRATPRTTPAPARK